MPTDERVQLRPVVEDDLPLFFAHQEDEQAATMAGVSSRPRDRFMAHWHKILAAPENVTRTVTVDGEVAGNIVSFPMDGERKVGYWIDRRWWGKGVATAAVRLFTADVERRPLHAHVVKHNIGSRRVLERCGFVLVGENDEECIFAQPITSSEGPR